MDLSDLNVESQVSLRAYTTLRVGGPARWLALVTSYSQLERLLNWAQQENCPWVVIGKGSNLLIHDDGFHGLVLVNRIEYENWSINGDKAFVSVGAGSGLAGLAARAAKRGWSGLEFACGIPATVGGAVAMNAGAHGGMIQDCLVEVTAWSRGKLIKIPASDLGFGYRQSRFHHLPEIVIEATFALHRDEKAIERVREMTEYRLRTQPWKSSTAGCFFRNPQPKQGLECASAGALIEKSGLKGYGIGDASVSELHANFLINHGQASCKDFIQLCEHIRKQVKDRFGYDLHGEVRYLRPDSNKMFTV